MRPLILVTNDDGIETEGINALAKALKAVGDVIVVAPLQNQSGVSHKLSLHNIVRVKRFSDDRIGVAGTPVDCVYLATNGLLKQKPDLVVSGINAGPNLGTDVHYSGTVGAAVEGTLARIPSIAVSCVSRRDANYDYAALVTRDIAKQVLEQGGLPSGIPLNINVPKGEPKELQWTYLGHRPYDHSIEHREDPRGGEYYWIGGHPLIDIEEDVGGDGHAVKNGRVSVTPMMLDMTSYSDIDLFSLQFGDFSEQGFIEPPNGHKLGSWSPKDN